jgi:hypothetical protein
VQGAGWPSSLSRQVDYTQKRVENKQTSSTPPSPHGQPACLPACLPASRIPAQSSFCSVRERERDCFFDPANSHCTGLHCTVLPCPGDVAENLPSLPSLPSLSPSVPGVSSRASPVQSSPPAGGGPKGKQQAARHHPFPLPSSLFPLSARSHACLCSPRAPTPVFQVKLIAHLFWFWPSSFPSPSIPSPCPLSV